MSIITLTTDFGTGSPYVAAMKGVVLSIDPAASIVDITHDVPPQDIRRGAVVLEDTTPWFPPETIHVAVVDPGVGSDRAIVYAQIGRQIYIAPDNGLLSRVICATPPSKLIRISQSEHWLDGVSSTFHGRDIMAPVAARLGLGLDPDRLGPPLDELTGLDWPDAQQTDTRIKGVVLEVDSFGNLRTNITADMLLGRPTDERVCIICNIYETWGIYSTYAEQVGGAFIALIGSNDRLELALVGDNAAARLGIQVGTPVTISWD
ncbi:MAG: SAM-dependent chlorinase/fluorinase [Thermoguttaceae bacterium]